MSNLSTLCYNNALNEYFCIKTLSIMSETRSGEGVSAQIGKMGVIDLANGNFSLSDGQVFNVKNDGLQPVTLSVQLAGMSDGDFIETQFECGWNPEIIKTVKQTSLSGTNLKWGY
ncbi:hypothetical protein IX307_001213 [Bacteroides pyogenes]|nr:hypothetical protein [Bacteroides pyogenes]MBR8725543.1 hypothetical protein [Bacteroides pyogenes]MBR8737676.1 hypothetical protein [Bacteroides pyogenes]MBR8753278.1 hypothetical protein [Bacteroides pyogenes]MBR8786894.1 hypothetical protein [Bacteroides pyogenes]